MKRYSIVMLLVVVSMLFAACAPATPQVIEKEVVRTVVVEKEVAVEKKVVETVMVQVTPTPVKIVNSFGVELPADAAPLDKQVWPLASMEGKHFDFNKNVYEFNDMGSPCWQTLVLYDSDWNFWPGDAESWETSADGLTWTFHLRDGLKWSDGSPLTAADYEFAFKRQMNPETASVYAWFYYGFKNGQKVNKGELPVDELGVKAVDDRTLTITTEKPLPYMLMIVSFPTSWPIPKAMVEKYGDDWAKDTKTALSNGPWYPAEWNRGRNLIMKANPYYAGPKKPMIETIIQTFIPQGAPTMPMYQANELFSVGGSQQADYVQAINDPAMRKEIEIFPTSTTRYIWFNTLKPPFDNIKVRQAVAHAIDRGAITDKVTLGMNIPTYTMIPAGIPCSSFGDPDLPAYSPYDPEKAKQLLAEAGYPEGKGLPEMEMWTKQGEAIPELEAIQSMLKAIGINVIAKNVERAVYVDTLKQGGLEIALGRWAMDYPDPTNFLDWWASDAGSIIQWKNAEFDKLIKEAGSLLDLETRCPMYKRAERIILEDAAAVFIEHPKQFVLYKPWVGGPNPRADGIRAAYSMWYADVYIKNNISNYLK